MSSNNPFAPSDIYGSETLWRTIGNYIAQHEQYSRSLQFYDQAVQRFPLDKKTLIDRSKARAKACLYLGALEDLKKVIELEESNLIALAERSDTNFLNCEFEDALIQNHRLLPIRKKPDNFFLGIMKCDSTIEQCLGEIAGKPMRDHFLIIRKLAWKRVLDAGRDVIPVPKNKKPVKKKKVTKQKQAAKVDLIDESMRINESLHSFLAHAYNIPPINTPFNFVPLQRYTKNIENFMAEKYLDRMYLEKVFLKKIKKHSSGFHTANAAGNMKLKSICKETYSYLAKKQELLRTRRPFYFIKYQEAKISGTLKNRQHAELLLHQQNYKKEALKILTKIEESYKGRELSHVLEMFEKLKIYCDAKPKRLLPDKDEYLSEGLKFIRKGFYERNRLNYEQGKWDQDKRILVAFDQPISRKPSGDSAIAEYDMGIFDVKQQIELFENRKEVAAGAEEICWCYHELGRYYMLNRRFEDARFNCKKGILEAQENDDMSEWNLNLHMLMARICWRHQNKNDTLIAIQEAFDIANKINDNPLKVYLKRCIEVVGDLEFDDLTGEKVTERRQQKILALMNNDKLKEEFYHLFRTMAAMPATRRMNLMGLQQKGKIGEHSSITLASSVGGKSKSKIHVKSSKAQDLNISTEEVPQGANFMALVQYNL